MTDDACRTARAVFSHVCIAAAVLGGCAPADPPTKSQSPSSQPLIEAIEVEEEISLDDLSAGGLTAARVVAGHDNSWTSREVPYLLRLLDDETPLVWTTRLGPIWSIDERTDDPTTPGTMAANRLIDMNVRLGVDVTVPLVAELTSGSLCPDWAAADLLNRLGQESFPAIRAVLEGNDEAARDRVLGWFRITGDSLEYGPVEQLTDEEAARWEERGDPEMNPFDSDTEWPVGIGGVRDDSDGR